MSASCTHKTFTNQTKTTYVITLTGNTGSVAELIGYGEIFNLEYEKIDPTKLHSSPIQSGRLEFNMLVRDADDQTILSNIFNSDEGSYSLSITQQVDDGAVKTLFSGSVLNDMLEISEADYPHEAKIVAKDFTGLKGKAYQLVTDSEFVSIKDLISDLIDPIKAGKSITYHTNYENDNVSGSFLDGTFIDKFGLRDFKEAETRDGDLPLDRYEILESLLKSFGLIMRQAEGAFRVYQLSSLSDVPTTTIDKNSKYILPSSLTQFNGGIKRASFAYNHRTVVKEINLPDRFSLSYDPDEQTVEQGLALKRDFSQVFNSEQDIRLHFRIDAQFPPREETGTGINFTETNNKFGRFQIKIVSASNTYYFKLRESLTVNISNTAGDWVTEPATNAVRLIGGGQLEGTELQAYSNVINLTIDSIPADADGNLTLSFINSAKAELNNGSVQEFIEGSRRTTFSINEFAITSADNRGNSDTLSYQIEQDGNFTTTYEHGTVLFGEGPVAYSPLALHYEATPPSGGLIPTPGEYEIILGGWSRGSGTAVTLAELLLQELIGNQSRGTKNLSAELYGNYNGHDKVLYDGVTYFMIGGVLNGNNVFSANFIELNFATDDLGSLTESAENVRSSVGGGFSTDDLLNFQTSLRSSQFYNTIFFSNFVGELSSAIQAGSTITSFTANLSAQIRAGEDFVLVDKENERPFFVNVVADPDTGAEEYNTGENRVVHVEEQFIKNDLPVGSPVILSGGLLESYFTIDPSKLLISVQSRDEINLFGKVNENFSGEETRTTFEVVNENISATNPVVLKDNQEVRLRREDGESQILTVNGNQNYTSSPFTITFDSFETDFFGFGVHIPQFAKYKCYIEPFNQGSSVASIDIKADSNEASITSLTSITDANGLTSSTNITQRANLTDATVVLKTDFNGNVGAFRMDSNADGSSISINADQITVAGQTTFLSALQDNLTFPEGSVVIRSATEPTVRPDGEDLQEGDVWIETDEGDRPYSWNGSSWTRQFTQIDGGLITTGTIDAERVFAQNISIPSGGSIASTTFSSGSSGFKINADGSAEFNNVAVRSSNFSSLGAGFELTGSGIQFNESVTIGSVGGAGTFTMQNPNVASESTTAGGSGSNLAYKHLPLTSNALTQIRSNNYFLAHDDHETLDGSGNEVGSQLFFGFYTGGASPTSQIQASGDGDFTFDVEGDIECTTLTETSDKYQKENIEPLGATLDKIIQLEGKTFDMLGASTVRKMGLLAQDVEPLFPEAVGLGRGENEEGERIEYKTLSYTQLIPALIESIKELKQEIDQLKNEQGI